MSEERPVIVVGAGLVGGAIAALLGQRGYKVEIYEKRPDQRIAETAEAARLSHLGQSTDALKRSINLALSHRGRSCLKALGLEDKVLAECVRMPCRAIHDLQGTITTQPYGVGDQAIWSASRSLLNRVVMEACEKNSSGNVKAFFEYGLRSVDAEGTAVFEHGPTKSTKTVKGCLVLGCDGAYSAVRNSMLRLSRVNFSREFIPHGYKELNVPPLTNSDGSPSFALAVPNALHIWPRHHFMMIALPNPDFSFTCTLFAPWIELDKLDGDAALVRPFFEKHFSDVLPLIPELEKQFKTNPSSALVMTHTNPWSVGGKIGLLGDAAHAIVPFYGQGANAGFEDCLVFCECLEAVTAAASAEQAKGKESLLTAALSKYAALRKPEGDAIARLSLDNYVEMRHKTASPLFLLRKQFENLLHAVMPETWIPLYSMVAFTRIPYSQVIQRAERQERILDWTFGAAAAGLAAGLAYAAVKHGLVAKAKDAVVGALKK